MIKLIVLLQFFVGSLAYAGAYFDTVRTDSNLPEHCQQFGLDDFEIHHDLIVYGIDGATDEGFTHEFPIERREARLLWDALSDLRGSDMREIRNSEKLSAYYDLLKVKGEEMGFDFHNEGEILEALALLDLDNIYPKEDFFHTGGVTYGNSHGNGVMGELDVLVGRKSDCKIIIVGEAKLGIDSLGHAYNQLNRFENFLDSYIGFGHSF